MNSAPTESTPEPVGPGDRLTVLRWEWLLLIGVVVLIVISRFPTLDQRILEAHAFRQTQTAFQTLEFHRSGIDILRPLVPVLGSPWSIPFEFPLLQAVASVFMEFGINAAVATRVTALGFFIMSAVLLWLLVRLISNRTVAATALVVFVFSPFSILWSRAALIEYLATAAVLGWVIAAIRWRVTRRMFWVPLAIVGGSIAMMVKATTALPWILPILAFRPHTEEPTSLLSRSWVRARARPEFAAIVAVPFVAGFLWTRHVDAVKAAGRATSWLTSAALRDWNFGTLEQRLDTGLVTDVAWRAGSLLLGSSWLIPLAVAGIVLTRRHRSTWFALGLIPIFAIGTFFNLYVQHDYYLAALSPAVAALLALGICSAIARLGLSREWVRISIAAVVIVWVGSSLLINKPYWVRAYEGRGLDPASVEIAEWTDPEDLVMVAIKDWNPKILYYADRRGMMLIQPQVSREAVQNLPDIEQYRLLYTGSQSDDALELASTRPWFAPVSPKSMRLGDSLSDLGDFPLVASVEPMEDIADGGNVLALASYRIPCDGAATIAIPAGSGWAWLRVRSDATARPVMARGLVPIPSQTRTLIWKSTVSNGDRTGQTLSCLGGGTLTVELAIERPARSS